MIFNPLKKPVEQKMLAMAKQTGSQPSELINKALDVYSEIKFFLPKAILDMMKLFIRRQKLEENPSRFLTFLEEIFIDGEQIPTSMGLDDDTVVYMDKFGEMIVDARLIPFIKSNESGSSVGLFGVNCLSSHKGLITIPSYRLADVPEIMCLDNAFKDMAIANKMIENRKNSIFESDLGQRDEAKLDKIKDLVDLSENIQLII